LIKHVAEWLAGGLIVGGAVNGLAGASLISAGVTWTLSYEWLFYGSLLGTSFFARNPVLGSSLPVAGTAAMALLLLFHADQPTACALLFFVGMTTASAKRAGIGASLKAPQWAISGMAIGCIALVLFGFDGVYHAVPILILGLAFGLIVAGATAFGILVSRPAKRLGDISYGIYLLQGPTLFLIFALPLARSLATESVLGHWLIVMLAAGILVIFATVTHGLVERPGVKAGQLVWTRISSMRRAGRPLTAFE
jgi:peptidoglycan/LPS O-acetylase OafA/YrhL